MEPQKQIVISDLRTFRDTVAGYAKDPDESSTTG